MLDVDAVIFDLDDTLYPEREFAFSGFAAVAGAFQHFFGDAAQATRQMIELFDTPDRPRVFDALLRIRGIQPAPGVIDAMVETYRRHTPGIRLYPDARRCLDRLRGKPDAGVAPVFNRCSPGDREAIQRQHAALGLITDGPARTQEIKIEALGLREWVDAVVLTDALGPGLGKPHPRAFECIAEQLRVERYRCVYVADNPSKDFVAPNSLGWTTVQVRRADGIYRDRSAPPGGQPAAIIESLDELEIAKGTT